MRVFAPWLFFMVFICFVLNVNALEENFCPFFVEIRNTPKGLFKSTGAKEGMVDVLKCTIIDGDFTISMINDGNHTNENFPVFQYLREITGALLIYGAKGLTNLNHIFPNLRIIGGQTLILNYALVIYQNDDFRFLGLDKLTIIRNGGVRITDNPKLCFARSINWESILIGKIRDVIIDSSGSSAVFTDDAQEIQSCNDEHGCKVNNQEKCHSFNGNLSCWNSTTCQTCM
uniref:Receptor L-domain domain-containing protein n=1 Tax=Panagrolaimus sp. PS1159 TaxID=55785 RepID=A0AC35G5G4_9BILA